MILIIRNMYKVPTFTWMILTDSNTYMQLFNWSLISFNFKLFETQCFSDMKRLATRQHALIFPPAYSPPPPGRHAMVSSVAACCVRPSYGARPILCIVNGDDSAVFFRFFCAGDLDFWLLTLTFELGRDFYTMYLTAKFDRPTFSRSEFILRTYKQTNRHR